MATCLTVARRALLHLSTASVLVCAIHAQTRRALLIGIDDYAPPAGTVLPVSPAGHAADSRFAAGSTWVSLSGPSVDVADMDVLLKEKFGFLEKDINILPEAQATRQGILAAIEELIADTHPGDLDVFYFTGHGSRRLDTLSSKDHFDQTIVPIDAWKGTEDIRDKELALLFDKIVFDKQAHLTAIFDSCDSSTMARGISTTVARALPYDDRDVALEKKKDPATITELDLTQRPVGKQIPQEGNAVIVAAAAPDEEAWEALYPDGAVETIHGAFTHALVRVLQAAQDQLSANDVVDEAAALMHADPVQFQQPSLEGQSQESLFGAPVAAHSLHAHVTEVVGDTIKLDMGSAASFDVGTQFTLVDSSPDAEKTVIEVKNIDSPLSSTAQVVKGPAGVQVGETFTLSTMVYPKAARLIIFSSKAEPSPADTAAQAKKLFPGLTWVDDPTVKPVSFLVVEGNQGWIAYDKNGKANVPGSTAKGAAFLLLGPPEPLLAAIEQSPPFQQGAFQFTQNIGDATYLLASRPATGGIEYSLLFSQSILALPKPGVWVTSNEDDKDDAELNGTAPSEVVCSNNVSLPIRTAWLLDRGQDAKEIADALTRRIVRLGKLRVWMQSPSIAPGLKDWPYHLSIVDPNTHQPIAGFLHPGQAYRIQLTRDASKAAVDTTSQATPKYVYLFLFDCAANLSPLYPRHNLGGDPTLSVLTEIDGNLTFPFTIQVGKPLGADTLFLLGTQEIITDPSVLQTDGVLNRSNSGRGNGMEELFSDMNDAGKSSPRTVPPDWLVQQIVLPSRP